MRVAIHNKKQASLFIIKKMRVAIHNKTMRVAIHNKTMRVAIHNKTMRVAIRDKKQGLLYIIKVMDVIYTKTQESLFIKMLGSLTFIHTKLINMWVAIPNKKWIAFHNKNMRVAICNKN